MIHNEIKEALESIGVPIDFHTYEGDETTYITYFQYGEDGSFFTENEEKATDYFYQIDIYSDHDYATLVQDVKDRMKAIGASRLSEAEFYVKEKYQRSIRFQITRTVGGR